MTGPLAALFDRARTRLADAPREALGRVPDPRRILGFTRAPRIVPAGTAWHLGVLLLTDDEVLATGEILRARRDAVRGYTAESQRRRSDLAAAAARGGFPEGSAVHVGWRVLDLGRADDPIDGTGSTPTIRWSTAGLRMPLAAYLDERVDLLLHPPEGAT